MDLQSYHYGLFERLWLKFELRSVDKYTESIMNILPVLLFMQKEQLPKWLDKLPSILSQYIKPHLVARVFSAIVLKLQEYTKNEQLFIQNRHKALECIAQNIQLYGLVLDMLSQDSHSLNIIEQVVRKKFDKDYELSKENLRLLAYQEKHCGGG
ncbi:hypothetical protein LS71_002215 [Helicobacter jaachi]|uniref:Uncharacterized protein n=1 Tax=Helicobacter jaachi TaxID=1677920 RepID=A0A4U8TCN6_9HELI|nr:hypothetical protein [Helicobacter jaachi]TLD97583.1 hypothetical protein LS71_002215 [Helicobacter jaachi]